jgi:hypothetical protein
VCCYYLYHVISSYIKCFITILVYILDKMDQDSERNCTKFIEFVHGNILLVRTLTSRPRSSISFVHFHTSLGMSDCVSCTCCEKSTPNVVIRLRTDLWPHSQCKDSRHFLWLDKPHCKAQEVIWYIIYQWYKTINLHGKNSQWHIKVKLQSFIRYFDITLEMLNYLKDAYIMHQLSSIL